MKKIYIKKLECFGKHGVLKEENILGQKFLVSCVISAPSPKNDSVDECVNYALVAQKINDIVSNKVFKLIETLADNIAKEISVDFNIKKVTITVEKPWAPIGLPLKSVAVKKQRQWHDAYIGLGSNIGDSNKTINEALKVLESDKFIRLIKCSSLITTKPYGYTDQPDFLNGVAHISTIYEPYELLEKLNETEAFFKRKREIKWGPRTLDLDIVMYDDLIMSEEKLTIPHYDMQNRAFVLDPMCEIAPFLIHPVYKKTMLQLKKEAII